MRRIKSLILNNSYFKNILILATGTILSHIILLITLPIITRLYTPDMFGVLTIYMSIMGLLSVIVSLKYELAIPNPNEKKAYLLGFLSIIVMIIVSFLFFILGKFFIYNNFLNDEFNIFTLVLAGVCLTLIYNTLTYLNIREGNYKDLTKTKVTRSLSLSLSQILFGLMNFGYVGLIFGEIIGRLFGNLRLFSSIKTKVDNYSKFINFKNLKNTAIEFRHYPVYTAPSWFINNSVIHLIPLFITYKYGIELAGVYFMAYKIMSIPELILSQSINQAFTGKFSKMIRNKVENPYILFISTVKKVFFLSLVLSPLLSIFLYFMFPVLFGEEWGYAGELTLYMIPLFISQFTMSSMYIALNILNKQKKQFIWDIFRFILICILILLTVLFQLTIEKFVLIYSFIIMSMYGILFILIRNSIDKLEIDDN